jgi:hypothetical protein
MSLDEDDSIGPSKPSKPFIGFLNTEPDRFKTDSRSDFEVDTEGDEMLEAQGAEIVETHTYNPVTDRTITRYPSRERD